MKSYTLNYNLHERESTSESGHILDKVLYPAAGAAPPRGGLGGGSHWIFRITLFAGEDERGGTKKEKGKRKQALSVAYRIDTLHPSCKIASYKSN